MFLNQRFQFYILSFIIAGVREFCSTEEFKAECKDNEVIFMTGARYGRMKLSRCVNVDFGFIGCSSDMIGILDRKCSGRQKCSVRIPDPEMDLAQPCIGDLTRYLEASYKCVRRKQFVHTSYHGNNVNDAINFRNVLTLLVK